MVNFRKTKEFSKKNIERFGESNIGTRRIKPARPRFTGLKTRKKKRGAFDLF